MAESAPNAKAVFDRALEIESPTAREAYLAQACAGDAARREKVDALLKAYADAGSFLETSAAVAGVALGPTADFHDKDERAGVMIDGKYTLVEPIGEGGMGSVWRAKQTEPVKRFVAVKLIKTGMDSKQVLARFEAERQALALMDHPSIAKVLDGGLHERRPFFVMELVKGVPITEYCDARKLTPQERLELFVPVCQAIQHAHQKGIIHRDIKPSNVLVALYDDKPVVKVIDFGVAKATGGALTESTIDTGFGGVVGTPQYMSPEQATFNNLDIDTRSDVYALGVLLYELLTGSPPFSKKDLESRGLLEMLRVVREEEPPRPSNRLSTADALPTLSANRGTEPKKLTGLLRNDLDWIVMKALEKDRSRRYETANGFAADVLRYLAGEAVQAHPPSAAYRLRKFARRNQGRVVAASMILLALLGGLTGTAWGLMEARRSAASERVAKIDAQDAATAEKAAADKERAARLEEERQRKFAEAISRFVQDDVLALTSVDGQDRFGGAGKELLGKDSTLRELLDRAAAKLRSRKDLDPRIEAELCWIIGLSYKGAGDAKKGTAFLERTVKLRNDLLGRDHPETLKGMQSLAVNYSAAGRHDLAEPLFAETFERAKAQFGPEDPIALWSMDGLAGAYLAAGKLDRAVPLAEDALRRFQTKYGPEHPDTLVRMNNLAAAYHAAGNLDRAVRLFEECLQLGKAKLGPHHLDTLWSMDGLAGAYEAAGKLGLAVPLFEETLKVKKDKLGADHPSTLVSMTNLAGVYYSASKFDLALPLYEESLRLMKAKLGADHPHTLTCMSNLAVAYRDVGKLDLALPLLQEALRLRESKLGPEHPDTLASRTNLAGAYDKAAKFDLAIPLYEETLRLMKAKLGDDHPFTLTCLSNLAGAYYLAGKRESAMPLLEEAFKRRQAKLGAEHPDTLNCMHNLATAYADAGEFGRALPMFEEAVRLMKAKFGPDHQSTLNSMNSLAEIYIKSRKLDLALPLVEETLKLRRAKVGPDHPDTLTSMHNLAVAHREGGRSDLAVPLFEQTLKLRKDKLGPNHLDTFKTMSYLAATYWSANQLDKSIPFFESTLKGFEAILGRDDLETLRTVANLGVNYKDAGRFKDAIPLLERAYQASRQHPPIRWVGIQLLEAYVKSGDVAKFNRSYREQLAEARSALPKNSPQLASLLSQIGLGLLQFRQWSEAESFFRECLAIREDVQPNEWSTFNTMSLLGGALLGQKKYTDAEPLLRDGFAGMKQREKTIPPVAARRIPEALDRLIDLYAATNKPDEVKKWQAERAKYPPKPSNTK